MFVVSIGMPKSGSTLFSWYQKESMACAFQSNGQNHFEQSIAEGRIKGIGHFIQDFNSTAEINRLIALSDEAGPFLVKTHSPVNKNLKELIKSKHVIATFIHRDPRDVILSAIDHGKRSANKPGEDQYFCQFHSVAASAPLVKNMCHTALEWINTGSVKVFKYEKLLLNPVTEISDFLGLMNKSLSELMIDEIIEKYTAKPEIGKRQFNTGKISRYHEEMTAEEIQLCNQVLFEEITALGYGI